MDVDFELKWKDWRLSFPKECITKENSLTTFDIDDDYWNALWIPKLDILEISSVEEVSQLKPSRELALGYVRRKKVEKLCPKFKYIFRMAQLLTKEGI